MKTTFIYILIDPRDNQVRYVGKANIPLRRFYVHLQEEKKSYKHNWIKSLKLLNLQPVLEIIDEVPANTREEWGFWEKHYISLYKSWGFNLTNMTPGGEGGDNFTYNPRKEEIRQKLKGRTSWNKGITFKEIGKVSSLKNKTYEEIYGKEKGKLKRDNCRKNQLGKVLKNLTKQKISKGNKNKVQTEQTKEKLRKHERWQNPIVQLTLEGKLVKEYYNIAEAERETNTYLKPVLQGRYKTNIRKGYLWLYKRNWNGTT